MPKRDFDEFLDVDGRLRDEWQVEHAVYCARVCRNRSRQDARSSSRTFLFSLFFASAPHVLSQGGLYKTAENYMRLYWQQMCEAVAIVHEEERIVHGDIKPQNFVSVQGFLKLIDFGIAKALDADTTHIGRDNLVGTLNYLAPETLKFSSQRQSKYGRVL